MVPSVFPELPEDSLGKLYICATYVLSYYLGVEWTEKWITADKNTEAYFQSWDNAEDMFRAIGEITELAELLLNLQDMPGFWDAVENLYSKGPSVGGSELFAGDWLRSIGVEFQFRRPTGVAKQDFDLDIYLDGITICGETKTKKPNTTFNVKSFSNSLRKAKDDNLPSDKPGIVIGVLPTEWVKRPDDLLLLFDEIKKILRGTTRLAGIALLGSYQLTVDDISGRLFILKFERNERCRFPLPDLERLNSINDVPRPIKVLDVWASMLAAGEKKWLDDLKSIANRGIEDPNDRPNFRG